jgi:hypothetical protein
MSLLTTINQSRSACVGRGFAVLCGGFFFRVHECSLHGRYV